MKSLHPAYRTALGDPSSDSPWLWLLKAQLDTSTNVTPVLYLNNSDQPITYGGKTYEPYPFVVGRWSDDSKGSRPTITIEISNASLEAGRWVQVGRGFRDRPVELRAVQRSLVDAGVLDAALFVRGLIDEPVVTAKSVSLPLRSGIDRKFPKRRYLPICDAVYKDPRTCGYVGDLVACVKSLTACEEHGADEKANRRPVRHPQRFRGCPAIPRQTR
ncbi:MAG: hypothetical protein KDC95_09770 [Planctomycetes bacterium]|nr:hypothetical protein [Planctomycetota bacterium]